MMHFHACFSDTHAVFGIATEAVTLLRAENIKQWRRHCFFEAGCLVDARQLRYRAAAGTFKLRWREARGL
jgi:hypothetical protein